MSIRKGRFHHRLDRWKAQYEALKRSVGHFGYVFPGSVVKRYMPCGKPTCRCARDVRYRHGPYYEWSRKVRGKTITVRLAEEQARLYEGWTHNDRKLKNVFKKMRSVSVRAGQMQTKRLISKA